MDPSDMTEMCAFIFPDQLLKMKSSEEYKKEVAASSGASTVSVEPVPTQALKPPDPASLVTTTSSPTPSTSAVVQSINNLTSTLSGENTSSSAVPNSNSNGNSTNGVEPMDTTPVTPAVPVLVYAKKSLPFEVKPTPPFQQSLTTTEPTPKPVEKPTTEPSTSSKPSEQVPSTSTMAPNISSSGNHPSTSVNNCTGATPGVTSVNEDEDAMTVDSSSDEDEDVYTNQFLRGNMGSDNNDPAEELVIKRNSEYLIQRCASLMQRLQGIMQGTSAKHVSRQLQAVLDFPGLNHNLRASNLHGRNSAFQDPITPSHRLTKQAIAEMQFGGKVMTNIIRHSMGRQLDPNDDSATEESDTDDDEVVLPDERMMDASGNSSSDCAPYLPVENNPFIEAVKLEKQYEARRTSIDFSINECEYSLTKSLALRKHCKARKPLFQLEKPSTSSNVINIPVDATSSVKFYHDSKPATIKRVSDMMNQRRSSLEHQDRGKMINGDSTEIDPSTNSANNEPVIQSSESGNTKNKLESSQESSTNVNGNDGTNERNAFIPTIKSMGSDGVSVLGVEFINNSDPNQSASRCAALKRPDKNRKVFQLGGIQNIFRDADRLPTVRCTCFGREELCALCLGRAKTKAEINHVHMNYREKLAILDETFHKTLSFPEDVPLEVVLSSSAVGNSAPLTKPMSSIQQLIKVRSQQYPPDLLETGPRPKKPRTYDIKPYVETPVRSPKKDSRYGDETAHSPRKRPAPRKSQSSFEEREPNDFAGKGLGWPSRERKDSVRRTRNQEFDIDNIVIPYSMAATTRVEQLVYKPIETPRWRVLDYAEIFTSMSDKSDGELEDMSNAAFVYRHNKCEVEEKKRFSQSLQKALNATRKTRRLDSTCRSESDTMVGLGNDENSSSSHPLLSPDKPKDKEGTTTPLSANANSVGTTDGTTTPSNDSTVITEAMANQALKSLFKVGSRRRTVSTSTKVEEVVLDEETTPTVYVEPWPERQFPLTDEVYKEMVESQEQSYDENPYEFTTRRFSLLDEDPPSSPTWL